MSKVLVLSLEDYSWLDEMYDSLSVPLKSRAGIVLPCITQEDALQALEDPTLTSVLIYEPSIIRHKNKHQKLSRALAAWTKAGGTTIYGACCASFAPPLAIKEHFSTFWDKSWESGDYHRTTFMSNKDLQLKLPTEAHTPEVSMKALHLKNVAWQDAVYIPSGDSKIESLVFPATPVRSPGQAPVVFAPYHEGKVGWVGDVNNEADMVPVVLAMLGL